LALLDYLFDEDLDSLRNKYDASLVERVLKIE
jgi:hypothetical protein